MSAGYSGGSMVGHFECFLVEDDPWFPWGDAYLCQSGMSVKIVSGEHASEGGVYYENFGMPFLQGINFRIEDFNGMEVECMEGELI